MAGADDYVTKPIDYDLLRATVEARLNRMQRLRAMPGDRSGLAALDRLALGVVLLDANGGVSMPILWPKACRARPESR